ncbi:MAG: hypothetical protein F6K31_23965 [Symploca sp. SIO2G7]|nr:hypothetical protein [Symploca sp. SIO2G7]
MIKKLIGLMGLLLTVGLATNASTIEKTISEQPEAKGDADAIVMPFGFAPSWSDNLSEGVASSPESTKIEESPAEQIPQEEVEAIITELEVLDIPAQEEVVVNQEPAPEVSTEELAVKPNSPAEDLLDAEIEQAVIQDTLLPNGTYLYGQSSQPEQIGQEYIVFEANKGEVVGALYMPSSEFSCFHGTFDSNYLNLTVVNPYDQTAISHIIAREKPATIATAGGQLNLESSYDSLTYPHAVGLEGYQQISEVSDNDHRILSMCRNNYQEQI